MRKKLPVGIQTFSNIIAEGYCYVNKMPLIKKRLFISAISTTIKTR